MSKRSFELTADPITPPSFFSFRWYIIFLVALFLLGLVLRLYDLTDPPLDDAYRQLHSAIIARGFFYRMSPNLDPEIRNAAIALGQGEDIFEPPIFEFITAVIYKLVGQELIWIPRLLAILWSIVGGIFLFILARRFAGREGAMVAFGFYWVGTWGMVFSRNFQPDGLMETMVIIAAYTLHRWSDEKTWANTVLAGLACGLAALIKIFAALFVGGMALVIVLSSNEIRKSIRDLKIWVMAAIMVAIPASVYLGFRSGGAGYFSFWTLNFSDLLVEPFFYLRWLEMIQATAGTVVMAISLVGMIILPGKARILMAGWWLGYFVYGLLVPWQIHTHDYYSVVVIPMVSLGLAPVAKVIFAQLAIQPVKWKLMTIGIFMLAVAYPSWNGRVILARSESFTDWRAWSRIGEALPKEGSIIALESSYGTMIKYFGMRSATIWPTAADYGLMRARNGNIEPDFEQYFQRMVQNQDYFLVTAFHEFEQQPDLKKMLYQNYEIFDEGDGYIIFNLNHRTK